MATCPQIYSKFASEVLNCAIDFSGRLEKDSSGALLELLTGTPTVTLSSSVIDVSSIGVSTGAMVVLGSTVSAAAAVKFSVSAGTAGESYLFTVTAGTNSSPTQTLIETLQINVMG